MRINTAFIEHSFFSGAWNILCVSFIFGFISPAFYSQRDFLYFFSGNRSIEIFEKGFLLFAFLATISFFWRFRLIMHVAVLSLSDYYHFRMSPNIRMCLLIKRINKEMRARTTTTKRSIKTPWPRPQTRTNLQDQDQGLKVQGQGARTRLSRTKDSRFKAKAKTRTKDCQFVPRTTKDQGQGQRHSFAYIRQGYCT